MIFLIIAVIAVVAFMATGASGAKGMVGVIFGMYLTYKQSIKFHDNGSCEIKGGLVFENQKQAKAFILNLIFLARMSEKDRSSHRYEIEIDTHGKAERFNYMLNGEKQWAELYNFIDLGDLITTIWYIESGLRDSYFFDENDFSDTMYDSYSSKVITREYKRQCSRHNIDELDDLV